MPTAVTYYALLMRGTGRDDPDGLARRIVDADGVHDEGLWADGAWHRTTIIVESERGEAGDELVPISPAEALDVQAHLHTRWTSPPGRTPPGRPPPGKCG